MSTCKLAEIQGGFTGVYRDYAGVYMVCMGVHGDIWGYIQICTYIYIWGNGQQNRICYWLQECRMESHMEQRRETARLFWV